VHLCERSSEQEFAEKEEGEEACSVIMRPDVLGPLRVDVSYVCQTVCIISSTHCSL